jgi:hypothetical protein
LPIKEIENLYASTHKFYNVSTKDVNTELANVKANLIDMSIEFEPKYSININQSPSKKKTSFHYKHLKKK